MYTQDTGDAQHNLPFAFPRLFSLSLPSLDVRFKGNASPRVKVFLFMPLVVVFVSCDFNRPALSVVSCKSRCSGQVCIRCGGKRVYSVFNSYDKTRVEEFVLGDKHVFFLFWSSHDDKQRLFQFGL